MNSLFSFLKKHRPGYFLLVTVNAVSLGGGEAGAVVGMAERYDEFKEQELKEFHFEEVIGGEHFDSALLLEEDESLFADTGLVHDDEELEKFRRELLNIPERKRYRLGLEGEYRYDSNIERRPLGEGKGDSVFGINSFAEFDLGGRKTDLRVELRSGREWNIHFPENDFYSLEERLRYRRQYFRKISHAVHSRLGRHSSKTVEMDKKRVRWDSHQNMVFNYAFSRKLSFNTELNALNRIFRQDPFKQDSTWQMTATPAVFWHITPKSRVALAYTFGISRIRSGTSDTNSHGVHLAYFGQLTRKSSLSFDASFTHQTPQSPTAPKINTITVGAGYILQLTPKTQLTFQVLRSLQDTTSELVPGTEDESVKNDAYFSHDSFNVSLNSRLTRKLTAVAATGVSHMRTRAGRGEGRDAESRQVMFPSSVTLNYMVKRWMQLRLRYAFAYRASDKKENRFISHQLTTGVNMSF